MAMGGGEVRIYVRIDIFNKNHEWVEKIICESTASKDGNPVSALRRIIKETNKHKYDGFFAICINPNNNNNNPVMFVV